MIIKAVIFDMDGTMFDTERLAIDTWIQAASLYGYTLEREWIQSCIGRDIAQTKDILTAFMGSLFPFQTIQNKYEELMDIELDLHGVPIKPGLLPLLKRVQELKIPMAVATSTPRDQTERMLELAQVSMYFDQVICGDDVRHGKPNPEIYAVAAHALGKEAGQCLVIEDSYAGVQAAYDAGTPVIFIPDQLEATDDIRKKTVKVLKSLTSVQKLFDNVK